MDNNIAMTLVDLVGLCLFDGTCNSIITQIVELPVSFPTGEMFNLKFYVTLLDSSCSSVLGYNWLKPYNLSIDWFSGHMDFHSVDHRGLAPTPSTHFVVTQPLPQTPSLVNTPLDSSTPEIPESLPESKPHISQCP